MEGLQDGLQFHIPQVLRASKCECCQQPILAPERAELQKNVMELFDAACAPLVAEWTRLKR